MPTSTPPVINTPLYQVVGGKTYKINLQTTASQVLMEDGKTTVQAKLDSLIAGTAGGSSVQIVENILARDAIDDKKAGTDVWVKDATGDDSVTKGAARYLYDGAQWVKTAEAESMDIAVKWADVADKPTSAVGEIDDAVTKKHEHTNQTDVLDKLAVDSTTTPDAPFLTFNGKPIGDNKVDVAFTTSVDTIPENLRDGGLLLVKVTEGV